MTCPVGGQVSYNILSGDKSYMPVLMHSLKYQYYWMGSKHAELH